MTQFIKEKEIFIEKLKEGRSELQEELAKSTEALKIKIIKKKQAKI